MKMPGRTVCALFLVCAGVSAETSPAGQRLLQLLQHRVNSTQSPETLADVAGALGSLALEGMQADDQTVTAIRNLVNTLMQAITAQHAAAQTAVDNQTLYEACSGAKTEAFEKADTLTSTTTSTITTTGAPTTTTIHPDLAACKMQESEELAQNHTCQGELAASWSAKSATCELYEDMNFINAGAARASRCAESTAFAGSYEEYLERDIQTLAVLKQRSQNCSAATTTYNSKLAECTAIAENVTNKLQECLVLEAKLADIDALPNASEQVVEGHATAITQQFCAPWAQKVAACSNYEACYASKAIMQDSSYNAAKELATSRQAEYLALKRIDCLLTVLSSNAAEQPDKLTACISATHDVSGLLLKKPTPPAKAACDPGIQPQGCVASR
mmetsp:Transcript_31228/g.58632  ORF Transcript_31228/g.58632 Transcript_31228/m.58632 type:complete len:388 (+) Transcript_31228:61-1224(+)